MKRRRIREIVAAAAFATWTVWPYEVVVFSDGRWTPITGGVHIETPVRCLRGPSKRATLEAALASFGLDREWPTLTEQERYALRKRQVDPMNALWGLTSDGYMSPDVLRDHFAMMEHLREPVPLP